MTVTAEPALISPDRLGALLLARRSALGLDINDLASRSGGHFTAGFLARAEQGLVLITDPMARQLTALYDLEQGPVIPERHSRLIVDLPGRRMAVGSQSFDVAGATQPLSGDALVDAVLERYLSVLYLLRDIKPGTEIPIRDHDLGVLGESLELELSLLERRLAQLMLDERVDSRTRSLIGRFLLPSAGLLVAATAVGAFLITSTSPNDVIATQDTGTSQLAVAAVEQLIEAPAFPTTSIVVAEEVQAELPDSSGSTGIGATTTSTTAPINTEPAAETIVEPAAETGAVTDSGTVVSDTDADSEAVVAETDGDKAGDSTADSGSRDTQPVTTEAANQASDNGGDNTPDAPADTVKVPTSANPAALGAAAESLISYDWKSVLPEWRVVYMGDRPGYRGLTYPQTKTIEIYLDKGDTPAAVAEILAHELGHAIDVTHFSGADRSAWIEARQMPAVWWAGDGLTDFSVGAGDFAEAVASLWVGSHSNSTYGDFTPEQLQLARQLIP